LNLNQSRPTVLLVLASLYSTANFQIRLSRASGLVAAFGFVFVIAGCGASGDSAANLSSAPEESITAAAKALELNGFSG
ncbi:MAG: hypothetical protein AB8B70_08545, partial [Prochlorococcus sp.]